MTLKFWNFGFEMLFQRTFEKKYKIHTLGGRQKPYCIDVLVGILKLAYYAYHSVGEGVKHLLQNFHQTQKVSHLAKTKICHLPINSTSALFNVINTLYLIFYFDSNIFFPTFFTTDKKNIVHFSFRFEGKKTSNCFLCFYFIHFKIH